MKLHQSLLRAPLLAALLVAGSAVAQTDGAPKVWTMADLTAMLAKNPPITISPAAEPSIPLSPGATPAGEDWAMMFGHRIVRNVTQAALYPVRPAPGKANGTAIIIAPGGAFLSLAFDTEGMMVANYLAERGITCFVLKYRLDATPKQNQAFQQVVGQRMRSAPKRMTRGHLLDSPAEALAEQDGLAAIRWVRQHAGEYGINPSKIGMIGFSAGGRTTMNVATAYDAASRPDYIGVIYGTIADRKVPADAPPAFIAVAADDGLLGYASVPIFDDWRAAGKSAELHVYAAGEHGFGMRKVGTTADHWAEHFVQWLRASRLIPQG